MKGKTIQISSFQAKITPQVQSLVGFEPSGTVAQRLGFQDIWDPLGPLGSSNTSGMTLWHAGTLLACWHTGTHAGTVDRPMVYRLMMITTLSIW